MKIFFWMPLFICITFNLKISSEESITAPEISIKSQELDLKEEIGFIRNEIFARHGRAFNKMKYSNYFSQFDWYKINPNYDDSLLTKEDIRDIKILKNYEENLSDLNLEEINFIKNAVRLLKQFQYREVDTTFISIGRINNDSIKDTVKTQIFCENDSIQIRYEWREQNKIKWKFKYVNPYFGFSDSELFQYGKRDIWIIFQFAVENCVFEFVEYEKLSNDDLKWIILSVFAYFKDMYKITESDYIIYLKNFKGQLVRYRQDVTGGNFDIWYEPLEIFVPYYRS